MRTGQPYQQPDLDSIEELNYISTYEEDAVIDAHIEELRQWGYGSISHVNDLHQLFWEFSRKGIVLDKLFRVAVVECIEEEPLYTKFLGMAKRYNGWYERQQREKAQATKDLNKKIEEQNAVIREIKKASGEAQSRIDKLNNEIASLKLEQKPKSQGALESALRHELKKEYNIKLQEMQHKGKPMKLAGRKVFADLCNTRSRFFNSFDLTSEDDIRSYIEWFRTAGRKVNTATRKAIMEKYGDSDMTVFSELITQYNAEWDAAHLGMKEDEDEND